MPARHTFTEAEDRAIVVGRANGTPWPDIAARLDIGVSLVKSRGDVLGVVRRKSAMPIVRAVKPYQRPAPERSREPLPAGSAVTWGAISGERWGV